jgi:hypothetical protein
MNEKQDQLKKTPAIPEKSEDEGNIRPEYVKKIKRIMKQDSIQIEDIDRFFDED